MSIAKTILPALPKNAPTEKQVRWAKAVIERNKAYLTQQLKDALLVCPHCEESQPVAETTSITTYRYTEPYGCTGGDYYTADDDGRYICNHCDTMPSLPAEYGASSLYFKAIKHKDRASSELFDKPLR